ncbi:DNA repair protein [Bacillus cereus Rock4-18]|nr:DNA repair protein [Bacillus cereus Rock4-18]
MRWVYRDRSDQDKRVRHHLEKTNDSWHDDETYIKMKGKWIYLYLVVDSGEYTVDFYLSINQQAKSAKRFF